MFVPTRVYIMPEYVRILNHEPWFITITPFMRCGFTNNTESNNMLAWEATEHDDIHFPTSSGCFPFFWYGFGRFHQVLRVSKSQGFLELESTTGKSSKGTPEHLRTAIPMSLGLEFLEFCCAYVVCYAYLANVFYCILLLFGSSANGRPELVGCLPSLPR